MTAKFLVVEFDDNDAALEMVRLMLDRGYVRLMLLDDLAKHPSLTSRVAPAASSSHGPSQSNSSVSISTADSNTYDPKPTNDSLLLRDILSSSSRAAAAAKTQSDKECADIIDMIHMSTPEQITINHFKEESFDGDDDMGESFADNEEGLFPFDFASTSKSHLDLLAQAHCLVGSSSPTDGPPCKKQRAGVADPEKDYHTCQICCTRVKAPRGGRWNLQMHVMAMHSIARPLKCPKCSYTDYRKPGIRKHTVMTHGQDLDPIDISTDEKRSEWDTVMSQCFPEFAYRTGFLLDNKNTSSI